MPSASSLAESKLSYTVLSYTSRAIDHVHMMLVL